MEVSRLDRRGGSGKCYACMMMGKKCVRLPNVVSCHQCARYHIACPGRSPLPTQDGWTLDEVRNEVRSWMASRPKRENAAILNLAEIFKRYEPPRPLPADPSPTDHLPTDRSVLSGLQAKFRAPSPLHADLPPNQDNNPQKSCTSSSRRSAGRVLGGYERGLARNPLATLPQPSTYHPTESRVDPVVEEGINCPDLAPYISLVRQVAVGGYSLVYQAEWERDSPDIRSQVSEHLPQATDSEYTSQEVAVKLLHVSDTKDLDPETKSWKHLRREIRVWSRLMHVNVVPLLGYVHCQNGQLGFVSPWYPEGNVIDFIKNHPDANRDMICADVASGLEHLHSQNPSIVHGDIKGHNILITSDGHALICDFGLSRILDDNPTGLTSTVVGMTLRFSAPELLHSERKTVETDVYAYGCACIEILLEKMPYEGIRHEGPLVMAIENGTPPISPQQLKECNSLLPLRMLSRCWKKEPSRRPRAEELAEAFRGAFVSHA